MASPARADLPPDLVRAVTALLRDADGMSAAAAARLLRLPVETVRGLAAAGGRA
ncbi:hypothetical protein [Zavarzinia sp.]|uniref:hypothetical protein n=1 Tax=Zavarzinia sp. TaxID=2027920 RepID=UPI003BB6B15D